MFIGGATPGQCAPQPLLKKSVYRGFCTSGVPRKIIASCVVIAGVEGQAILTG